MCCRLLHNRKKFTISTRFLCCVASTTRASSTMPLHPTPPQTHLPIYATGMQENACFGLFTVGAEHAAARRYVRLGPKTNMCQEHPNTIHPHLDGDYPTYWYPKETSGDLSPVLHIHFIISLWEVTPSYDHFRTLYHRRVQSAECASGKATST